MFSLHTFASLAMQLARLVPDPSARFPREAKRASVGSAGGCGSCPRCHEFVWVEFPAPISRPRARDVVSRSTSWRPSGLREDGQTVVGIGLAGG